MESAGGRCVFTSEWDKYAQKTYHANYRDNRPIAGDIREVAADDVPDHDVLVAGFPVSPSRLPAFQRRMPLAVVTGLTMKHRARCFLMFCVFLNIIVRRHFFWRM